jgi:filamentous hemagglutinin family protein
MLQPGVGRAAQVTTSITSSGLGTTVTQGGTIFDITNGTRRGANLFHSFGFFNIGTGDTANFLNDSGLATSNIIGRVNGGQTSSIFGTIRTTGFGSAHLFLINPFGWIFGNGAALDVGGSFHVSTADVLRFADGVFSARDSSPLPVDGLTANPLAFGFLSPNPTRISITGSSLQVPTGETLSVVGGEAAFAGEAETGLKIAGVAP